MSTTKAYQAMGKVEGTRKRHARGPTRRASQAKLDAALAGALAEEEAAIELAEQVSAWVRQGQQAFDVIDEETGRVRDLSASQKELVEVAEKLETLGTTYARWAAGYLRGTGQQIVKERQVYVKVMNEVAEKQAVDLEAVEAAAHLCQLDKSRRAATWPGTKERLWWQMGAVWRKLGQMLGERAPVLFLALCMAFRDVLATSSVASVG